MNRWLFTFGCAPDTAAPAARVPDHKAAAALLGGKGAGLVEMARLGIPVPPGFTLTTEVCRYRLEHRADPAELAAELRAAVDRDRRRHRHRRSATPTRPLLVSVRSGAPVSMPGMMDTVLNLGLNPTTVAGLAARTGDAALRVGLLPAVPGDVRRGRAGRRRRRRRARRGRVRAPADRSQVRGAGAGKDSDLSAADLEALCGQYHDAIRAATGARVPRRRPRAQLAGAIAAVFRSWGNPRADAYRRMHGISAAMGTGVTVQAMVFGNLGESSATGVAFTRDPASGAKALYGEFLVNAQGEDVVAGVRTPEPIAAMARRCSPRPTLAWSRCRRASRPTTSTCRTSSSRSRIASCGCCRAGPASAPARRWSRSPSTRSARA
jgi:pyruvate,orthophosphate dikinase